MASVFKIENTETKQFLRSLPASPEMDLKQGRYFDKNGRMFKRRGDVAHHISLNIEFYRKHVDRLRVIEFELVESSSREMIDLIAEHTAKLLSK